MDIEITPADVRAFGGAKSVGGSAGESLTAGQVVYLGTGGNYALADCDSASAAARSPEGIALNGAGSGQPVRVHTSGPIVLGEVLTPGETYYLSDTPGGICTADDLAGGDYATIIGVARSSSVLDVRIQQSGVALSGDPPPPQLQALSGTFTLPEDAAEDDVAGAIGGTTEGSTLSLQDDAGGRFKLVGSDLAATDVGFDYESAASHQVTVRETLEGYDNSPRDTVLTVTITNEFEAATLGALTLDDTELVQGESATVNIVGATSGSTITGTVPDGLTLNSGARTITGMPTTLGEYTFTLTETLADSANSPNDSSVGLDVVEAPSVPTVPPEDWRMPATVAVSSGLTSEETALEAAQAAADAKTRPSVTVADAGTEYIEWTVAEAGEALLSFVPTTSNGTFTVDLDTVDQSFTKQFPTGSNEVDRRQGIVLTVTAGQVIRLTIAASGGSVTVYPLLHLKPASGPWDGHLIFGPSLLQDGYKSRAMEASIIATFANRDPVCFNYARTGYTASQLAGISDDAVTAFGDCARYAWCGGLLANDIGNNTPDGTKITNLTANLTTIFDNLENAGMTVGMGTTRYFTYTGTGAPGDQSTGVRAYDSAIINPFIESRIPYCYDSGIDRPRYDEYLLDLFRRDLHGDTVHGSSTQYALERETIVDVWYRYLYTGSWTYVSQIEQRISWAETSATDEDEALTAYTEGTYAVLALDAGSPRDAFAARLDAIYPTVLFFEAKRLITIAELAASTEAKDTAQDALDAADLAGYVDAGSPNTIAEQQARIDAIVIAGFDQIINVRFGTASPPAGWNAMQGADTTTPISLVDENGDATSVALEKTSGWAAISDGNNSGGTTGSEIEEWPDPNLGTRILKSANAPITLTITGLETDATYDLVAPGMGVASLTRLTKLTVDGVDRGDKDETDLKNNPWRVSNIAPTEGVIVIEWYRGSASAVGTPFYPVGFVLKRHA